MDQRTISPRKDKLQEHFDDKHQKSESSGSEDNNGQSREWKCACQKTYNRQSSLHNHIRFKHDNQKEQFEIKTNSKPGRPKNTEGKDKQLGTKNEKKQQNQPSCVSNLDWAIISIIAEQSLPELLMVVRGDLNENYDSDAAVELPQDCQSFLDEIVKTAELTTQEADNLANLTKSFGLIANLIKPKKRVLYFTNYAIAVIFVAFDFPSKKSEQSNVLKKNSIFNEKIFSEFSKIIRDYHTSSDNDQSQKERQTKVSTEKSAKKHPKRVLQQQQAVVVSAPELEKMESGSFQEEMQGFQHITGPLIRFHSDQQSLQRQQQYYPSFSQQQQQQIIEPAFTQSTDIPFQSQHLDYSNNPDNRIHSIPRNTLEYDPNHIHQAQKRNVSQNNHFETSQQYYQQKYQKTNEYNQFQYQNNALNYPEQQKYTFQQNHQPNPQLHPNPTAQTYQQYNVHPAPPAYSQQDWDKVQRIASQNNRTLNITNQDHFSLNNNKVASNLLGEDNLLSTPCQNLDCQMPFLEYPVESIESIENSIHSIHENSNINNVDNNMAIMQRDHNEFLHQEQNPHNNKEEHSTYYDNAEENQFDKQQNDEDNDDAYF